MSYLLVLRIVPPAPLAGADFANYLTTALGDLRITAYDLSYANVDTPPPAGPGAQVGAVATYVAPTALPNPIGQINATGGYTPPTYPAGLTAGIVQYWELYSFTNISGTFFYYLQESVATAVIELNPPTNIENLRLVAQWGTGAGAQPIPVISDFYQLKLLTPPAGWQDPNIWPTLPAHAYIELPKPPPAASPYSVTIPADGSPPPFDALLTAVRAALAVDPGGATPNLGTLTIDQCRNLAYEIIWAQQPQLPTPPDAIDQLYTNPPNVGTMLQGSGGSSPNQLEGDRQQFEGNLQKYYSTADADADRLTSYLVALSRAVACEQRSVAATQAQLQFPADPAEPNSDEVTVTLTGITAFTTFAPPKSFGVPAAYFYALAAAMPSEMTAQQRYQLATGEKTERILAAFTAAINARTVTDAEAYTTVAGLSCNAAQAARRLAVLRPTPPVAAFAPLGSTASVPVAYPAPLQSILQAWLDYPPTPAAGASSDSYQPGDDATSFWPAQAAANPDQNGFLNLVLCALTQGYVIPTPPNPLGFQISTSLGITNVAQLAAVTTQQWQTLFGDNPTWLPPFTQPGNTDARIGAFIRYFERFFAATSSLALQSVDLALSVAVNAGTTLTFADTTGVISGMSAINVHYIPPGTTVNGPPTATQVHLALPPGTSLTLPIPQYTNITFAPAISSAGTTITLPLLPLPNGDPITACLAAYGGGFVFGTGFNTAQLQAAAATVFPGDASAQAWLVQACQTIDGLYAVLDPPLPGVPVAFPPPLSSPPPNASNLFFSCAEALYARGFTSAADIIQLSASDFAQAVVGTIAFDVAAQIYANAGTYAGGGYTSGGPFQPINPDGTLTDCIPPECLSPLGPIAYLNELLQLSESSTCEQPLQPGATKTLGSVVSARRGPIGDLAASCANLNIELPVVDLVNECLEFMGSVATPSAGTVYDTSDDALAGYKLCEEDCCSADRDDPSCHPPEKIYAALAEYSTPGVPVPANSAVEPAVYDTLEDDFSTCCLPYSQTLDVARTYLRHFRSCRFEEMRAFRKCITEFVLDPVGEPSGFQTHLWRYPVRIDSAIEYLGITPVEYGELFQGSPIQPCGAPTDYRSIKPKPVSVQTLYGSRRVVAAARTEGVMGLPQFLEANCLTYCEFLELWHSGYVPFTNGQDAKQGLFPDCEPCCLDDYWLEFPGDSGSDVGLLKLAIFVRLWRKLRAVCGAQYTFAQLRDICDVLQLFSGATPNPDFIRQLASFQILRDRFCLPLSDRRDPPASSAVDAARSHLLALWVGPTAAKWQWAVGELLEHISQQARKHYHGPRRDPEFLKILANNLDGLSALAGFDPTSATDNWHALPTHTLRFAEVLSKLHASPFSIEEIFFLFTVQPHLDGDDPFDLQEDNEALDLPLGLPDDDERDGLWRLREKLLEVRLEESGGEWNWRGVERFLTEELGFAAADVLALGQRFFPEVLERSGHTIPPGGRRFTSALAVGATVPAMWNGSPDGAFRYDSTAQQLWTEIPLADKAVIERLMRVRVLNVTEQGAVQDLRFQPRAQLCRFALLFADFEEAQRHLIEERDEHRRWEYFTRHVALCHARCAVIAEHLAHHVARATHSEVGEAAHTAKLILRHLFADENLATSTWEDPTGATPAMTWPTPAGGGFAAILGLLGTGLMAEFTAEGAGAVWRDIGANLAVFGAERNDENCPVPTVLPALNLALTPEQMRFISVRNGFALRDSTGAWLGGAQGFEARWSGALLIECEGSYEFLAREALREAHRHGEHDEHEHQAHHEHEDHAHQEHHEHHGKHRWRVTLKRGQRTWVLLAHRWPGESDRPSSRLPLRRGAYELSFEFVQPPPSFSDEDEVRRLQTGIDLLYNGPDTRDEVSVIPRERLFCVAKDATLGAGLTPASPAALQYLQQRYFSSLRDIRRTYQRAFKSLLFAHRLELASVSREDRNSELGYMLQQPANFAGLAYYRSGGAFATHAAGFDFNLLPLLDQYHPPAGDARATPSPQRMQALFDWWERLYDYSRVRTAVHRNCGRAVWPLFMEALQLQSAGPGNDPQPLLRHICADARHWAADLHYFQSQFSPVYAVTTADLEDDRWLVRAWHADQWLRALDECFCGKDITRARPDLWASGDPSAVLLGETVTGNANLTQFLDDGLLDNGDPRRYEDLRRLNDGLRERGRAALISYLCANNRVTLPWLPGTFAQRPRDLSDLLLIDVESGICQTVSRIDNAISAVQTFIQRARLGLEPGWTVSAAFARLWDRQFATFCVWRDCKRRHFYKENFIECVELDRARGVESFRLLQSQLHNHVLSAARPAGLAWWPDERPPAHPTSVTLQENTPAALTLISAPLSPREGIDLMATPDWSGRQNWLSAVQTIASSGTQTAAGGVAPPAPVPAEPIPYWMEAAIKMGTTFLRIAAAGYPLGTSKLAPHRQHGAEDCAECCRECGCVHPERVDEYYFWLVSGQEYAPPEVPTQLAGAITEADNYQYGYQDNFYNQNQQQAAYWHDETQRPQLLEWKPVPTVRLAWCRVHNGRFQSVRQSTLGIMMDPSTSPDLSFYGRMDDSLVFAVYQPATPAPIPGYQDTTSAPGFRYDLATDAAVVLPLVGPATTSAGYSGNLPAYPYFAYDEPGSHLFPLGPYSPALAIGCFLRVNCQFEAALKWYALAFDPLQSNNTWIDCDENSTTTDTPPTDTGTPVLEIAHARTTDTGRHVRDPIPGEACCDSTDITCAQARDRSVVLDYLEALRDWGDAVMRRNTREAYEQARTIYDTARWILGKPPRKVKLPQPDHPPQVSNFVPSFPPLNPRLMALYELTNDRLAMIHRCLSSSRFRNGTGCCDEPRFCLDRRPKSSQCAQECGEDCGDEALWCHLPSPYRFQILVGKAVELASACRALGADLLAAFEKADAAYLEELRARQEREMAGLAIEVRKDAWRDSDWQVEVLQKNKSVAQANLQYYKQQIENGLITPELAYQDLTIAGTVLRAAGNIVEAVGGGMSAAGNYFDGAAGFGGSPLIYAQLPPGSPLAGLFSAIARIMTALADVASSTGSLELTEGGWQRRADEWLHQTQVLAIEIEQIETQILASQRRRDQALHELNNQERQREHAAEVQDFLRDKFTSQDLYLHLQKETAALYRRSYDLAFDMARRAERAFNFERGHTDRRLLPAECWDNLHAGLTAGQRLETAIRGMEKAYLDENLREYELTKHFSLRLHFPLEFLRLKATGCCEIQIPEWMFDFDYPGMYMRRIKNVSLTLPCVTGPYTGVHCRLTLLSSRTRIDPRLSPPAHRCCSDRRRCSEYEACADDPRMVREYAAREAIATSSGQADNGMFEMNFRDERYLPFEYFGAVSCWRIELPRENNYFNLDTLSDIILHMNYTAREGGEPLRRAANADAHRHVPGDGWVIFDMRRDLAVEWERFRAQRREGEARVFEMDLQRDMFPFIPNQRELRVEETALLFYSAQDEHEKCDAADQCPCPEPKRHDCYEVELTAHEHRRDRQHRGEHEHRKGYLHCRGTEELQHLYSGRLRERLGELGGEHPGLHLKLEFECDVGRLEHAYLLFRYSVPTPPARCEDPCRLTTLA
jgi:hypothetical protein